MSQPRPDNPRVGAPDDPPLVWCVLCDGAHVPPSCCNAESLEDCCPVFDPESMGGDDEAA